MLFLGFSAGLPLLLVGGTFTAWLRDLGVGLAAIGLLSWVGIAHSIKVLWAPVVDRAPLPWLTRVLGRRRAWMLAAQTAVGLSFLGMAAANPVDQLWLVAIWAVIAALGSATQDVAVDAYRVEAVARHLQAAMAAAYVTGYRVALLVAGAGVLHIAAVGSWSLAYAVMGMLMAVGIITTLVTGEPEVSINGSTRELEKQVLHYLETTRHTGIRRRVTTWLISAVICPFADFFKRYGRAAVAILVFVALFRISDIFMGVMANPFYLDLGFDKTQIANVAAAFGLAMTLAGAAAGGLLTARFGIAVMLLFTAFMAPATNLLFAWLAVTGPEIHGLAAAIIADNITGGLAISVFLAYLSSLTNSAYTATQYALLSSLMTLPGQFAGGFTGMLADHTGWAGFFLITAAAGIPAIVLAIILINIAHPDHRPRPGMED
jgi:PAT family beta-lactamase induction signal transducer AmpG